MINEYDRKRAGRARLLRREGKTYNEIRAVIGKVGDDALRGWLRGIPRPPATYRTEIDAVSREIGAITARELFLIGLALYWAEGSKSKPWRRNERVSLINSDPSVIVIFMQWLALVGVSRADIKFRVSIHETADVLAAQRFWAALVGTDVETFHRPTIKRHNPKTTRHNIADQYRGCLTVDIARSAVLYRRIEGWWRGLGAGLSAQTSDGNSSWHVDRAVSSVGESSAAG